MRITFDPAKETANVAKHGLSLGVAAELDWDAAVVWEDVQRDYGEVRYVALAPVGRRLLFVAYTQRNGLRRIISLRKANLREIDRYETETESTDN